MDHSNIFGTSGVDAALSVRLSKAFVGANGANKERGRIKAAFPRQHCLRLSDNFNSERGKAICVSEDLGMTVRPAIAAEIGKCKFRKQKRVCER